MFAIGYDKQNFSKADVIDLTKMSKLMAYSSLFNIILDYKKYVGKEIVFSGIYSCFYDSDMNKRYHACIIQDETACCLQGLAFVPDKKYSYPKDFPKEKTKITVRGTLSSYEEDGNTFCQLINTVMEYKK